jgi:hypothetical protein
MSTAANARPETALDSAPAVRGGWPWGVILLLGLVALLALV